MAEKCDCSRCRKAVLREFEEEARSTLAKVLTEAMREATEKPPIWWQWLMLMGMGVMGGIGLGLMIAYYTMRP